MTHLEPPQPPLLRGEQERISASGGILRQLIEENSIQLAHYKSEVERLERRQRQLEVLFEELRAKTGEDLDDEDEENDASDEEE